MKTLLIQLQRPILETMGPFKIPMIVISILVLAVIVLIVVDTFARKNVNLERRKRSMSTLLVLGSMNAIVGMLGQIMGIWFALAAILQAADINPDMVMGGLMATFTTTIYGLVTFIVALIAWLLLNYLPILQPKI